MTHVVSLLKLKVLHKEEQVPLKSKFVGLRYCLL